MPKLLLCFALVATGQSSDKEKPRQANPLAPSLPLLTKEEADRYEAIINRFIKFDIGDLKGGEGKKALDEFNKLPAEAIFELIDGFNRAANLEHSCPAVIIGRKIMRILGTSDDMDLILFAKENVGAGVTAKRHLGMIREVQTGILLRRGELQRRGIAAKQGMVGGEKSMATMPLADLVKKAGKEKGPELKSTLTEIEKRQGPKVFETLAIAAAAEDMNIQKVGAALLAKHMTKQTSTQLKDLFKHERLEVRASAAKEVGTRKLRLVAELIDLLNDGDSQVRQASHTALVQVTGVDHGPDADASFGDRETAQRKWREWWDKQKKK